MVVQAVVEEEMVLLEEILEQEILLLQVQHKVKMVERELQVVVGIKKQQPVVVELELLVLMQHLVVMQEVELVELV